jgi:hypothetical protein
LRPSLLLTCLLCVALTSCRRRAPGTCRDHIDCDPGFDCVAERCTRRAPVGGASPPTPPAPDAASVEPLAPPPARADEPTPLAPPQQQVARSAPKPNRPDAAIPAAAPVPVDERLPMWKQRARSF